MSYCAVYKCKNYSKKNKVTYHRFPKDPKICKLWVIACGREDKINIKNARICSNHFKIESYKRDFTQEEYIAQKNKFQRNLKEDAVPTENLPRKLKEISKDRSMRIKKRENKKVVSEILSSVENNRIPLNNNDEPMPGTSSEDISEVANTEITEMKMRITSLEEENHSLKQQVQQLTTKNMELSDEIKIFKNNESLKLKMNLESLLSSFFTKGQIKTILMENRKLIKWSSEDIAAAISLRSVSPKCYRYLRDKLRYPLPCLSTLRRWALHLNLSEGILDDVLLLLKNKATNMSTEEKLVVISFDETYLSPQINLDKKQEKIIGPFKAVQTVFVRGLLNKWKQIIYYKFDQQMTSDILLNIIIRLEQAGYFVVAVVSDMGGGNLSVWKSLQISPEKTCIPNPADSSRNVYFFADPPHLLKLFRNHFLDQGFLYNGKTISKTCVESLLEQGGELNIMHKVSTRHLDVKGTQRQKVKTAAQLISNTVSKALLFCGEKGLISGDWKETADMIKVMNDWFDLFNARSMYGRHSGENSYGMNLEEQNRLLCQVTTMHEKMRAIGKKSRLPFQTGILICNKSLIDLYNELNNKFNVKYILTYRLNQDLLEHFFSYIRSMGGTRDHPSAADFQNRLRWYILGKHASAVFVSNQNTEVHSSSDENIVQLRHESNDSKSNSPSTNSVNNIQESDEIITTEILFKSIPFEADAEITEEEYLSNVQDANNMRHVHLSDLESNALLYIAGYVHSQKRRLKI